MKVGDLVLVTFQNNNALTAKARVLRINTKGEVTSVVLEEAILTYKVGEELYMNPWECSKIEETNQK